MLAPNEEDEAVQDDSEEARAFERMCAEEPTGGRGDGQDESEEREVESRRVRRLERMRKPTPEEKAQHESTGHAVYRPWCESCVAGRGHSKVHRQVNRDRRGEVPVVSIDYGFMGPRSALVEEDNPDVLMTFLGIKDRECKAMVALTVPEKGSANGSTARRVSEAIDGFGHSEICLRSDGERAIEVIKREVRETRPGVSTVPETSPPGDHAANGGAEQVVQSCAGLFRTNKHALEKRINARIGSTAPILLWLMEYGPTMHLLFKVGQDGRTPKERMTGRGFQRPLVPFGQKVMYEVRPKRIPRQGQYAGKMENQVRGRRIGRVSLEVESLPSGDSGRRSDSNQCDQAGP